MSDYKQKYKYYKYKYLQLAGAEADAESENLIKIKILTMDPDIEDIQIKVPYDATVGEVKNIISTQCHIKKHYIVLDLITGTTPQSDEHLIDDILIRSLPVLASSGLRTLFATFLPPKSETDILLELKSINTCSVL